MLAYVRRARYHEGMKNKLWLAVMMSLAIAVIAQFGNAVADSAGWNDGPSRVTMTSDSAVGGASLR